MEYGQGLWLEGGAEHLGEDALQNRKVAIFSTASTTGSGMARLLKRCALASRVHLCPFINRMSNDIASTFVQRHGVTFSTFQRLYSGSPSLHRGSYHTAALQGLDGYRKSCLSNRLLLYVDEQIAMHRQEHPFLESARELQDNPKILAGSFDARCITAGATYDLATAAGQASLRRAIQSWDPNDKLTLLRTLLDEACCRYEAEETSPDPERYLAIVVHVYSAGGGSRTPDRMRELILSVLFLERHPGERLKQSALARGFYGVVWRDFINSVRKSEFGLAVVCLRTCAKLDPRRLLESLGDAVRNCAMSRLTELSLSLELSKMRDDAELAGFVLDALRGAKAQLVPADGTTSAESVAFGDLLRDLGVTWGGSSAVPMGWEEVERLLAAQPPDLSRTVRAAIRTLRQLVPGSTIEYVRRLEGERFILADSWPPPRQASAPAFPLPVFFTHKLIGADGMFFTSDLAGEPGSEARGLIEQLAPTFRQTGPRALSMFVAELTAGARSEAVKPQVYGPLRVQEAYQRGAAPPISDEANEEIRKVVQGACELLGRPETTHVAKLGAWQYEHAVSGFGRAAIRAPERESTLQVLADLMLELLEADLCRVAVRDLETRRWKSGPLSGKWWEGSRREIDIADTDENSTTVRAAREGRPVIIPDVQEPGASMAPNKWVRGCVALPLGREGSECDTVITLWHHVADWFAQCDNALLDSLAAIGGARVQRVQAIEVHEALEQEETIRAVARHIGHSIGNNLPVGAFNELAATFASDKRELADKCIVYVENIHWMRRRFEWLADMKKFGPDKPQAGREIYKNLEAHVRRTVEKLNLIHGQVRVRLENCAYDEIDGGVICNLTNLQDDLMEMVTNSVKHGGGKGVKPCPISVSLTVRSGTAEDLRLACVIAPSTKKYAVIDYQDCGVGIGLERKQKIFDMKRGAKAHEKSTGSLGLGLPLTRDLVRKLGGDVIEIGEPGAGVRFLLLFATEEKGC